MKKLINYFKSKEKELFLTGVIYVFGFSFGYIGFLCGMGGGKGLICTKAIPFLFYFFGFGFAVGEVIYDFMGIFSEGIFCGALLQLVWSYLMAMAIAMIFKKVTR